MRKLVFLAIIAALIWGFYTGILEASEKGGKGKGHGPRALPGDNLDDPRSGKVDRIGDGNSGQGDDLHKPAHAGPKRFCCWRRCRGKCAHKPPVPKGDQKKPPCCWRRYKHTHNPGESGSGDSDKPKPKYRCCWRRYSHCHRPRPGRGDGSGDNNKGHGNDPGRYDPDNPGKGPKQIIPGRPGADNDNWPPRRPNPLPRGPKFKKGDHDKGHGNDPGHFDPDNPGRGGQQPKNRPNAKGPKFPKPKKNK